MEAESSPRRSDAILGQRKEETSKNEQKENSPAPNEKMDLRWADPKMNCPTVSDTEHNKKDGEPSGENHAQQQVFADEPVLELPLVDPKQIVDFAYFALPPGVLSGWQMS